LESEGLDTDKGERLMPTPPANGDVAPDFTLPGTSPATGERDYTLSAERGHPVVLAFYPGDETPVCTKQLCSYQNDFDTLAGLGLDAQLWGISSQDIGSHQQFQANRGLTFPLLADVDNAVFAAYGLGSRLTRRRAVFVIDADGYVAWSHVSRLGITYQKLDAIADVLRDLPATSSAYPADDDVTSPTSSRTARGED
jgi:thioredoxin-dependent peroxiredoxin